MASMLIKILCGLAKWALVVLGRGVLEAAEAFLQRSQVASLRRFLEGGPHRGIHSSGNPRIKFGQVDDFFIPDLFNEVQLFT